jgi:predicted transposase/invertase (TIGR01784 family)
LSYDNTCKYLAENYPEDLLRWVFNRQLKNIKILNTEINQEPIQADALVLLQTDNRIIHLEFQTLPYAEPPMPLRMLDYKVRLTRQYNCEIEQVVIFLKSTTSRLAFQQEYRDSHTVHSYRVIRMWEQDPSSLLATPALLPLATLAASNSPENLLRQVAQEVARIADDTQRQNLYACADILAGLRFDKGLIRQLFREDIMRESVTYQDILQKGVQQGRQEGRYEGELTLLLRQLTRRLGEIAPNLKQQIQALSIAQLDDLGEALLDFAEVTDLVAWLQQHNSGN